MDSLGIIHFPAFLLAGIMLNITPGSDTVYILARSISMGKSAGIVSALGIATGACLHTLAAGLGLSILLMQSACAFQVVKYGGACYLIYIGWKSLKRASSVDVRNVAGGGVYSAWRVYFSGVLTNVLNPKVALFFLAFLPQFVDTTHHDPTPAFLLLGLTFITTGTIWCLCLAVFAAKLAGKVTGKAGYGAAMHRLSGALFICLGCSLALTEK